VAARSAQRQTPRVARTPGLPGDLRSMTDEAPTVAPLVLQPEPELVESVPPRARVPLPEWLVSRGSAEFQCCHLRIRSQEPR